MTSSLHLSVGVVFMLIAVGAAKQYKVGDSEGWHSPDKDHADMYEKWAGNIRFQLGDTILFEYRNDSVIRVDKRGYYHCNESSQNPAPFKDGNTLFLLDLPGFYYFTTADSDHCKRGQRLMIDVMGPHSTPGAPSGPSPAPRPNVAAPVSSPITALLVPATALLLFSWTLQS